MLGRFIESSERLNTELKVLVCWILKSMECNLVIIKIYCCIRATICNTFLIFVQVSESNLLLAGTDAAKKECPAFKPWACFKILYLRIYFFCLVLKVALRLGLKECCKPKKIFKTQIMKIRNYIEEQLQVQRRFKSCSRRVGESRWWASLTMVPARNKVKRLSSVNHVTKTICQRKS